MPSTRLALLFSLAGLAAVATSPAPRLSAFQAQITGERPAGPTIDFVALDATGSPATDLQPSEVEIRLADRARTVRTLRRVAAAKAPTAAGSPARLPSPYGTNDNVAAGRRFVLVIDQESFVAGQEQLFRAAIDGLLAELTPADRTMVAALPFGGVMMPFTSDTTRIRLAAGRVTGQGSRAESGSALACRTRRFLESLEGLLRDRGTLDSPQTLVVFTAGLAGPRRDAPMGVQPGMCELEVDLFRQVASTASAVRANVYIMQPADVGIGTALPRPSIAGDTGSDNPLEGIEHLAGATGGTRLPLDATGTTSLLRVARESSTYYVAELEPIAGEVFGRSRRLSVRVARPGITVRTRPDVVLLDAAPARPTRLTVSDILGSTEAATELRLRIGGFTVRDPDGRLRVGIIVEPVDSSVTLASAGAILIDGGDRVVTHWHARDATERPLIGALSVPPGPYRVRAAAIDTAGRPGAAELEIDAGLTQVGELSLGSLLLSASRGGVSSLQLEFGSELTARASFDIYGGTEGQRLSAALEVSRTLDGPAMATVPLALSRADDSRVVATGTVPLGALAPGDYVVRGIIRLENGTSGRVVRTLRKVAK